MGWDSHLYIQFQPSNTQASAESTGWQSSEGTGEERAIGQGQICQGVRQRRQLESILARWQEGRLFMKCDSKPLVHTTLSN